MPIRTASMTHEIQRNGAKLHRAMASRVHSHGVDQPASEEERALRDERRSLKEAKAQRQTQTKPPKAKAAWMTKEAKPPKAPREPKEPKIAKEVSSAKSTKDNKPSRAEKLARKAETLEAAKKATKKSAKT